MSLFAWWLLLCGPSLALGQVSFYGRCPKPAVVKNFDVKRYAGKWFAYERYYFEPEINLKCSTATYTPTNNGKVAVLNRSIDKRSGKAVSIRGEAFAPDPYTPAKLKVSFGFGEPGNYWVLDTDYVNYSVVFACTEMPGQGIHEVTTWILSRSRSGISYRRRRRIHRFLWYSGIDPRFLYRISYRYCPRLI